MLLFIYGFIFGMGGGDMCHIWISCEGSEANIAFGFFKTNFGRKGVVAKCVSVCICIFLYFGRGLFLGKFLFFCEVGLK